MCPGYKNNILPRKNEKKNTGKPLTLCKTQKFCNQSRRRSLPLSQLASHAHTHPQTFPAVKALHHRTSTTLATTITSSSFYSSSMIDTPAQPPPFPHPQRKVHHHGAQQRDRQNRGPKPVVKAALAAQPDASRAPVEGVEGVQHRCHRDGGEEGGADLADAVAKIEEADGEATEQGGEVEPGEKGAFVGEVDFWLDAGGEGDAFAWWEGVSEGVGEWRDCWCGEKRWWNVKGRRECYVPGAVWRRGWVDMVMFSVGVFV